MIYSVPLTHLICAARAVPRLRDIIPLPPLKGIFMVSQGYRLDVPDVFRRNRRSCLLFTAATTVLSSQGCSRALRYPIGIPAPQARRFHLQATLVEVFEALDVYEVADVFVELVPR